MTIGSAIGIALTLVLGVWAVVASLRIRRQWYFWLPLAIACGIYLGIVAATLLEHFTTITTIAYARIWPWRSP